MNRHPFLGLALFACVGCTKSEPPRAAPVASVAAPEPTAPVADVDEPPSEPVAVQGQFELKSGQPTPLFDGWTVTYEGGGHKILADPDGNRGGDLTFYELTFSRGETTHTERRFGDDWNDWKSLDGLCWRGAGEAQWHPESVVIEVRRGCPP